MSFPSKADREKCWASRDDFWKCLDDNAGSQEVCSKFRELYENSCPSQWVKHFDRKREYLKFKDRIQKEGNRNSCNLSEDDGGGSVMIMDPATMTVRRRSRKLEGDLEDACSGGIRIAITRTSGDNLDLLNESSSSTSSSVPSTTSSTTKIPSPRIYRRFQTFQPPTYS